MEEGKSMSCSLQAARRVLLVALALVMAASLAFAQGTGSSTTLSGLVTDAQKAVIPGADVLAKNNATAAEFRAVTDETGRFSIPAVPPGTYTVTVTLMGFKTAQLPDVIVQTATPASVTVTLDVGQLEETVVVTGATEIVQTQSANVSTTLAVKQLQQLPVITHTALDAVVSLPGVETAGSNTRGSVINGLPTTSIAITLDGVNVQDKRGNEGFFMYIRPMMDSVEEITVSTSTPGAEASGGGSAVIRMETRSGSNRFSGSAYNTWRNQAGTNDEDAIARTKKPGWLWRMNTPYWFNKRDIPKTAAGDYFINDVRLQTPGFRVGGPVLKDKLFYFFNYEEFRLPESRSRTRYILNTAAQAGVFTYPATDGTTRTVNLLALAATNGQTATVDQSIAKLLADIRTATATTGGIKSYDQLVDQYDYVPSATQKRKFPTLRLDYNLTSAHRVTFSTRYNDFNSTPDFLNSAESRFPGFPNLAGQVSGRYMWQGTVRSTFGKSVINEARVGAQDGTGKGTYFGQGVDESQFNCTGLGCQAAGGKGWSFGFPSLSVDLTGASAYTSQSASVAAQTTFEDTLTWLKGSHSISMGGNWTRISSRGWSKYAPYSGLTFGTSSLDTVAYNMLDATSGNFPGGINSTWAGYARNLYGFLTGRVTAMSGTAYLQPDGKYAFQGDYNYGVKADSLGFFVSDSWRAKPNFTVNAGVRYQLQLPMTTGVPYTRPQTWQMVYGLTGAGSGKFGSGNLYKPGTLTGTIPQIVPYDNGSPAYNTDWNNVAPSVGATWRPNLGEGVVSKILSSDPVFRGGYSVSFNQLGVNFFDTTYFYNPGISRTASRSATTGTPVLGYDGWPVLLRDAARLTPSAFPTSPTYPITPAINENVRIHYPDWPVTYTNQYSFGFQRELGKSMALDVRYVGNTNVGGWTTFNMNNAAQWSMLGGENGFYDEYRKAQANLRANIIAGNGTTFAYTGAPGTSPLPIFQAYFAGTPLGNTASNGNPANYTSANYRNSSWYNSLMMYERNGSIKPGLTTIAGTGSSGLQNGIGSGTGLDANRIAAGLPINFFIANPTIAQASNGSNLDVAGGNTRYNAMQIELRRRMSNGLLVQGSYSYAFGRKGWSWTSLRDDSWHYVEGAGSPDHAFKLNWVYELPFGQGKKWGSGAGSWMNALIGGWEWDGVARVQSGQKFNYGGFRLVGMSEQEFQDMFKFYHVTDSKGVERIYMLPQDVIENSILALYTMSATTASGYAGALPTGRYLAPPSGPDCVQYLAGTCPGTAETRLVTGPMYGKVDMSFVKRFQLPKRMTIEARMEIFNILDTINFNAIGPTSVTSTTGMGAAVTNWQVTSAATDASASQDPGGRITQFGLRFTW
jgi:hypothetical protein